MTEIICTRDKCEYWKHADDTQLHVGICQAGTTMNSYERGCITYSNQVIK